jgi:hypothetical protein
MILSFVIVAQEELEQVVLYTSPIVGYKFKQQESEKNDKVETLKSFIIICHDGTGGVFTMPLENWGAYMDLVRTEPGLGSAVSGPLVEVPIPAGCAPGRYFQSIITSVSEGGPTYGFTSDAALKAYLDTFKK